MIIIHQRCRCIGKPGVLDAMIVWSETLAVAVVIYPVYNLTKRVLRSSIPFAASSYLNNMAEWAWGFIIGHHLGWCLEVCSGYFGLFHEWYFQRFSPKVSEEERRFWNLMLVILAEGQNLCRCFATDHIDSSSSYVWTELERTPRHHCHQRVLNEFAGR